MAGLRIAHVLPALHNAGRTDIKVFSLRISSRLYSEKRTFPVSLWEDICSVCVFNDNEQELGIRIVVPRGIFIDLARGAILKHFIWVMPERVQRELMIVQRI